MVETEHTQKCFCHEAVNGLIEFQQAVFEHGLVWAEDAQFELIDALLQLCRQRRDEMGRVLHIITADGKYGNHRFLGLLKDERAGKSSACGVTESRSAQLVHTVAKAAACPRRSICVQRTRNLAPAGGNRGVSE